MHAIGIVVKKVSNEGFNIPVRELRKRAVSRIIGGQDLVFQYGQVVFTVSKDKQEVHMYADSAGCGLLPATAKFMKEVWSFVPQNYLVAAILNERIKLLAKRFGWIKVGELPWGHSLYFIRRAQ